MEGVSEAAQRVARALEMCDLCGHSMSLHSDVNERIAGRDQILPGGCYSAEHGNHFVKGPESICRCTRLRAL